VVHVADSPLSSIWMTIRISTVTYHVIRAQMEAKVIAALVHAMQQSDRRGPSQNMAGWLISVN